MNYINEYNSPLDNNDFLEYTEGLIDENYEYTEGLIDENYEYTEGLIDENYESYDYYEDFMEVINIKTLNEKYPLINWKLYFEKRFESIGIEIPINDESLISEEKNFKYLYKYLEEIDRNDLVYYIEL